MRRFQTKIKHSKNLMAKFRNRGDSYGIWKFKEAQKDYLTVLAKQNVFWKQRAKEHWLKGGDTNTRFFHNSVNRRRRNNTINRLKDDGEVWVEDKRELGVITSQYFKQIFQSISGNSVNFLQDIEGSISDSQNE